MTSSVLLALFGLPLSLLTLGGIAVLLHQRANGAFADAKKSGDPSKPGSTAILADMEARLAQVLKAAPDGGPTLTIHGKGGQVLGVLLPRDDYELLTAVAASEPGSDRIEAEDHSDDHYISLEEVFGLRRS